MKPHLSPLTRERTRMERAGVDRKARRVRPAYTEGSAITPKGGDAHALPIQIQGESLSVRQPDARGIECERRRAGRARKIAKPGLARAHRRAVRCQPRDSGWSQKEIGANGGTRTRTPIQEADFHTTSTFAAAGWRSWSGLSLHHGLSALGAARLVSTPSSPEAGLARDWLRW